MIAFETTLIVINAIPLSIWLVFFVISVLGFPDLLPYSAITLFASVLYCVCIAGFSQKLLWAKYFSWVITSLYLLATIVIVGIVLVVVLEPNDPGQEYQDIGKAFAFIFGGIISLAFGITALALTIFNILYSKAKKKLL